MRSHRRPNGRAGEREAQKGVAARSVGSVHGGGGGRGAT